MKSSILPGVILVFVAATFPAPASCTRAADQVITYPAPAGAPLADDYQVTANGQQVDVYTARLVQLEGADAEHNVRDVSFENVTINGQLLASGQSLSPGQTPDARSRT